MVCLNIPTSCATGCDFETFFRCSFLAYFWLWSITVCKFEQLLNFRYTDHITCHIIANVSILFDGYLNEKKFVFWKIYKFSFIKPWNRAKQRSVFRTESSIWDGTFFKNGYLLSADNYFRKMFHLRCLTGFWISL